MAGSSVAKPRASPAAPSAGSAAGAAPPSSMAGRSVAKPRASPAAPSDGPAAGAGAAPPASSSTDLAGSKPPPPPEYPLRPGVADCSYYAKDGTCRYGMKCWFNHPPRSPASNASRSHHNSNKKQQYVSEKACNKNCHEGKIKVEQVKTNFIGLPLRPGAGLCAYYMQRGTCKSGTNCKFHHPDPKSEHVNSNGSCNVVEESSQLNISSQPIQQAQNELYVPSITSSTSLTSETILTRRDSTCTEQGAHKIVGVSKDILEHKRDNDVELADNDSNMEENKQGKPDWDTFATIKSEHGTAGDGNDIVIVDKGVNEQSEVAMLQKSSNREPNLTEPKTNCTHAELNHLVNQDENVSPGNSATPTRANRVGSNISEIMELVVDAGVEEGSDEHFVATKLFIRPEYREMFLTLRTPRGRLGWLKMMCQEKE